MINEDNVRFKNSVTNVEIRQREKERIPEEIRKNTAWAVNVYQAWTKQQNRKIETLADEYSLVSFSLQTTNVKEADYWLTRFILEARSGDGKPYPANSLYSIATGLLRHFRNDLKRFDLNILPNNDGNFS